MIPFLLMLQVTAPNCFSKESYLQGDIQSRLISLYLVPQEPMDELCYALNNTQGSAKLFYQFDTFEFQSENFTFIANQTNVVYFNLNNITMDEINELIRVHAAQYEVSIEKSAQIVGTINLLKYLRIDVSSCWSNAILTFTNINNSEELSYELFPNECTIPENAVLHPLFTYLSNGTQINLAEFQHGTDEFEYKQPYIHQKVKFARLLCRNLSETDQKNCLTAIKFISENLDYSCELKLIYKTENIETAVIQDANEYFGNGSKNCAIDSNLKTYIYPDGFFIFHGSFELFPACQIGEKTATTALVGVVSGGGDRLHFTQILTLPDYQKHQFYHEKIDMTERIGTKFSGQPQYVQYGPGGEITGQMFAIVTATQQCVYLVILKVLSANSIQLEIRQQHFEICSEIDELVTFSLFGEGNNLLVEEKIWVKIALLVRIQSLEFELKSGVKAALKRCSECRFQVQGESFFFVGEQINYVKDVEFLVIQFGFVGVYLVVGFVGLGVVLRRNKAE